MIMKFDILQLNKEAFMERAISSFMGLFLLWAILVFDTFPKVSGNSEVDALHAFKNNLVDPKSALQNWNPAQANPCLWDRVTCNSDNSVTRIDLGDKNLSGQLVPQLGQLPNLQYLELYSNNISGKIPDELGNLTNLVSLDLYLNRISGPIPDMLGNLRKLRFLRLNNNMLSGNIPMSLTSIASLQSIDLSNNQLTGVIPINGSFALFTPNSFVNNPGLKPPQATFQMPRTPSESSDATPGLSSGPANEMSPAPSPSLGNSAASCMLPISFGSLLLALFVATFSGF